MVYPSPGLLRSRLVGQGLGLLDLDLEQLLEVGRPWSNPWSDQKTTSCPPRPLTPVTLHRPHVHPVCPDSYFISLDRLTLFPRHHHLGAPRPAVSHGLRGALEHHQRPCRHGPAQAPRSPVPVRCPSPLHTTCHCLHSHPGVALIDLLFFYT